MSPLPIEQIIPNLPKVIPQLERGFAFEHTDGHVEYLKINRRDELWVRNVKRGIANILSVNVVGTKDKSVTFENLEVSLLTFHLNIVIHGISLSKKNS